MDIDDALGMIRRIENLPEIYNRIERAVCAVVHSYYQEMLELEKLDAEIMSSPGYDRSKLDLNLQQKSEIYNKYWCNSSSYYQPCSSSSSPEHLWDCLSEIEILQNGDDENSLYIFKAKSTDPDHGSVTQKAFVLKLVKGDIYIEHEFFG